MTLWGNRAEKITQTDRGQYVGRIPIFWRITQEIIGRKTPDQITKRQISLLTE